MQTTFRRHLIPVILLIAASPLLGQNADGVGFTFGMEFRRLTNLSFFSPDSALLIEDNNNFRAVNRYTGGFGFGGVVRARLTDFWNLESGIYYTRRVYEYSIADPINGFSDKSQIRTVGYEIPLKGLVYIQMGRSLFMNVALGVSADFFASDAEIRDPDYSLVMFKESWIRFAALGNLGLEWRTEESGYFYLGGTFHQPFGKAMSTWVEYFRDGMPPRYLDTAPIDIEYFSIDFRYFFPITNARSKVRYVKPDWKNM